LRFWNALGAAALVAGLGVYAAGVTGEWANFARSGAVITLIGAVVAAWDAVRAGDGLMTLLRRLASRERTRFETLGLGLIAIGALIWTFGEVPGEAVR
jgi:hypothetical protein